MSDVLDNYIPLKRIKVLDGECVGDVWEGVGNRVFEMPDCPTHGESEEIKRLREQLTPNLK